MARQPSYKACAIHKFATYASSPFACLASVVRSMRSLVIISILDWGRRAVIRGATTVHSYLSWRIDFGWYAGAISATLSRSYQVNYLPDTFGIEFWIWRPSPGFKQYPVLTGAESNRRKQKHSATSFHIRELWYERACMLVCIQILRTIAPSPSSPEQEIYKQTHSPTNATKARLTGEFRHFWPTMFQSW